MTAPLRIAMCVGCFPVVSETFILRQIAGLLDLGHQVAIFADLRGDAAGADQPEVAQYGLLDRAIFMDMPEEAAPWELPVWPLTGRAWVPGGGQPRRNAALAARALPRAVRCLLARPRLTVGVLSPAEYGFQAASLSGLYRLSVLRRQPRNYDVIHAHFGSNGNSYRFARELWRAPFVVSFHGYDFCTLPRRQGAGMYRRLFATADAVTVNSEFTRGRVVALGCPEDKLHRLPVGLDLRAFPFRERSRRDDEPARLLTVARLVEIKGHEEMLRCIARLREVHPGLRYDIVGEGPLRPKLERLITELRLHHTVTLHGARGSRFVRRLLRDAHLAVLASVSIEGDAEGQGLFLQEAQACGLPVVATRHGALPEGLQEGRSGFLVPERNVDALTDRLNHLLTHPELWPVMGRAGRLFVEERYDITKLNAQLVELYRAARTSYRNRSS